MTLFEGSYSLQNCQLLLSHFGFCTENKRALTMLKEAFCYSWKASVDISIEA